MLSKRTKGVGTSNVKQQIHHKITNINQYKTHDQKGNVSGYVRIQRGAKEMAKKLMNNYKLLKSRLVELRQWRDETFDKHKAAKIQKVIDRNVPYIIPCDERGHQETREEFMKYNFLRAYDWELMKRTRM